MGDSTTRTSSRRRAASANSRAPAHRAAWARAALIWGRLSGVGSIKTLRLQRDPDGLFLWHPDYAPWIVGRRSRKRTQTIAPSSIRMQATSHGRVATG
jgi:hypothetical protein